MCTDPTPMSPLHKTLRGKILTGGAVQYQMLFDVKDQNSGFKAFRREAARGMDFDPRGFLGLHRFILPLASIKGCTIAEIPIAHYDRPTGRSYIKFYTVPFITLRDFFRFREKYL